MKKLLRKLFLFALLFSGGLALLFYLSAQLRQEQEERVKETADESELQEDLPFTRIPEQAVKPPEQVSEEGEQDSFAGTFWGEADFAVFEEGERGNKVYELHVDNVTPLGEDIYDLEGITAHTYDPENGSTESTLIAKRGRARLEWRDVSFVVGHGETVKLFDAVVTLHQGVPMAPLTLTMASVEGDLETDIFTSQEMVLVEGEGIRATGLGVIANQRTESLVFKRDGHVQLEVEGGREVELLASGLGPMTIRRSALLGDLEQVELTVEDGARAILHGQQRSILESRELHLHGETRNVLEEGELRRRFVPVEALAFGEVNGSHALSQFSGGRARLSFDDQGEVQQLTISEQPVLGGEAELDMQREGGAAPVWIELHGRGPLVLDYDNQASAANFDMLGPATLQVRDTDVYLAAAERIDGRLLDGGAATTYLRGAVQGQVQGMDFRGSDLTLDAEEVEGSQRILAKTQKPAHLEGLDKAQRPIELDTKGTLHVLLDKVQLFVPLATEAHLEVVDGGLWTLDVGVLTDLDVTVGSFQARAGVLASGPSGTTRAERAIGHSRTKLELFGLPASDTSEAVPVRNTLAAQAIQGVESGLLRAMHLVLQDDLVQADDSVELRFHLEDGEQSLDCEWAELRVQKTPNVPGETPFEFEARGVERGLLHDTSGETLVSARQVTGHGILRKDERGDLQRVLLGLVGSGGVTVSFTGNQVFTGIGERFTWSLEDGGRLEAKPGERVEARGRFKPGGLPYILKATWIESIEGRLEALAPKITRDLSMGLGLPLADELGIELRSIVADWMAADDFGLLLTGNAHFEGLTRQRDALELDAASIHLEHRAGTPTSSENFESIVAWDGFVVRLGDDLVGRGEVLEAGYETLRMEGRPARLEAQGYVWESYNLVYDVPRVLVTTDQGRFTGAPGTPWEGWTATYESLQPFEFGDTTIMAMRHPVLTKESEEIRADWALLWVDRDEWVDRTSYWVGRGRGQDMEEPETIDEGEQEREGPAVEGAPTLFGRFDSREISKTLKEVYLEGGVEYLVDGDRVAKLDSAYIDMADGHGWFRGCEFWVRTSVRGVPTRIAVRADWLHHSADGTLSADEARITDCEWAEPDYVVKTRNLRMKPADDKSSVWDILLRDNSLVFSNGLSMPLPRVHYKSDGKGLPTLGSFRFGDSARFGTFVQATMNIDVGDTMAKFVAPAVGIGPENIQGNWRLRASYYDLRGPTLGTGFHLRAADKFWMNLYVDGVYDTGRDVGFVRTKTAGSNEFRWVIHTRGRYLLEDKEWFDFQFATQSDAGVQAEFYEGNFVRYDKRHTFLRWRKAQDANYFSANARIRTDEFRNDVERLPDLGALHGRTPVAQVAGVPLLYTASVDAAYLRRRQGNSAVFSPFDPVFTDGLGNRDYLRADTRQRIEAPFATGLAGVRVTPYGSFGATVWSEGQDSSTAPSRGALIAGVEAQSTYFRTWKYGVVHDITPMVGVRADLGTFDADGTPIQVDPLDAPMEGKFVDFGLRSRWHSPGSNRELDIAARLTHGTDVGAGVEEGWQPMSVLASFMAVAEGVPFAIQHDARYDLSDGDTTLSYTSFSVLPWKRLGFEWAYNRALDDQRERYYDAMTVGAQWMASPKWQIEGRQTISRIDQANLDSTLLVRRIGHDFIFEVVYGFRAGEGRSSLTFNFRPELGWRQPGFGLIDILRHMRL